MDKKYSFKSRIKSFGFALNGLRILLLEPNFIIHLVVAFCTIVLGFAVGVTKVEWLFLVISIGSVLFAEAVNTSLEYLVDLVSPGFHDLAKACKDVAAMAVLLLVIVAVIIGSIIFISYFLNS